MDISEGKSPAVCGFASGGLAGVSRCLPGIPALLPIAGCSAAPSQDVLGSFFPAWMLCAGFGIAVAVGCRFVLAAVGFDKQVLAPPLGYLSVAVAATLGAWLYRFGQ